MPIPPKLRFVSNALTTYLRQRFQPPRLIILAIFIFLFSRPAPEFKTGSFISFVLLMGFLLVFRLYDDLMQADNDRGKPDRNYTDPAERKTLFYYLICFFCLLSGIAFYVSNYLALLFFCFITVNHLLYILCITNKIGAGLLPLLKYPFVFFLLQFSDFSTLTIGEHIVLPALSLFLAFVAFESMEDKTFPIPSKYSCFWQVFSFILILAGKLNGLSILTFFLLLSLSLVWHFFKIKAYPYQFLLCFLVFRMLIDQL